MSTTTSRNTTKYRQTQLNTRGGEQSRKKRTTPEPGTGQARHTYPTPGVIQIPAPRVHESHCCTHHTTYLPVREGRKVLPPLPGGVALFAGTKVCSLTSPKKRHVLFCTRCRQTLHEEFSPVRGKLAGHGRLSSYDLLVPATVRKLVQGLRPRHAEDGLVEPQPQV